MSNDYCEEHGAPFPCIACRELTIENVKPHVCPPLSPEMKQAIEAQIVAEDAEFGEMHVWWGDALRWVLSLAEGKEKP
jgi:hypothetical protein